MHWIQQKLISQWKEGVQIPGKFQSCLKTFTQTQAVSAFPKEEATQPDKINRITKKTQHLAKTCQLETQKNSRLFIPRQAKATKF